MVATNSQSRCREQGIPFYRFSPKLKDVIAGSETDNEKLFNMVIQTRIDTREQGMEEVVRLFHTIAGASHHLASRIEEVALERENHHKNEQCLREVQKEKPELNTNLNDQPGLLEAPPSSSSSQPVLSDIEESVEVSSKKSYKLPSVPQQPSALATFVVGDETQDTGRVSAQTAAASRGGESETDGPSEQDVRRSESTNANALGGGKGEREVDIDLDQSAAERELQTREESPQYEADVIQSQNSSVFSTELASPNEPEISSPQENGDDNGFNAESQVSPDNQSSKHMNTVEDVAVKKTVTSPLEPAASPTDHAVPSLVKLEEREVEGKGKPQIVLKELKESSKEPTSHPVELKESVEDKTTPPEVSQESKEDQRMPPGLVTSAELMKDRACIDQPPTQQDLKFPSQQTLEDNAVNDVSSIAPTASKPSFSSQQEGLSTSHDLVTTSVKFAGEEREEVCSHQMKQEGLNEAKEERTNSTVNGGSVIGVTIPMGSSHSSFISLESPQISGPPKKKIPRTANDERGIPNGDFHFTPSTIPSTAAEQHSIEIQSNTGLVNGCKSHTQVPKLENGTNGHKEVPNHYKLDIQLTPETQQDAQSKFPYRFETEI